MNIHMKMPLLVQMVLLPAGGEWSEISTDSNLAASGVLSAFECQCQPLIERIRVMTHWGWNKNSFSWNWFMGQPHNDEVPELIIIILNSCGELSHKIHWLKSSPWQRRWIFRWKCTRFSCGVILISCWSFNFRDQQVFTGKPIMHNPIRANGQIILLSKFGPGGTFRALPAIISEWLAILHMVQDFEPKVVAILKKLGTYHYDSIWINVNEGNVAWSQYGNIPIVAMIWYQCCQHCIMLEQCMEDRYGSIRSQISGSIDLK